MSISTTFKPEAQIEAKTSLPEGKEPTRTSEVKIEVPYLDYEAQNAHPYTVDYFKLGDTWNDPQGGFPGEIGVIEDYIQDKIKTGDIANSTNAIKELIKGMEKVTNMTKEERNVIKIEVLANYVEFLMKNDAVKRNMRIYGTK